MTAVVGHGVAQEPDVPSSPLLGGLVPQTIQHLGRCHQVAEEDEHDAGPAGR